MDSRCVILCVYSQTNDLTGQGSPMDIYNQVGINLGRQPLQQLVNQFHNAIGNNVQ